MRAPEFWAEDGPWPRLLAPAAAAFTLAARLRARAARPWRAPVPVICVGNLTVGGAGKTPTVLALCELLQARGRTPHLLTRGYGGREAGPIRVDRDRHGFADVGDEALLLAAAAPTWVARDRAAGARAAVEAGARLIVMDDGLQNPHLAKNLSLVVIDGGAGFGNGRVMPAGPLREPLADGFARASALVLVGEDRAGVRAALPPGLPLLAADFAIDAGGLAGRPAVAFAGIGRPAKFFEALAAAGVQVLRHQAFADHHPYRVEELAPLLAAAEAAGAALLTTEKDAVRLPPALRGRVRAIRARLLFGDAAALEAALTAAG